MKPVNLLPEQHRPSRASGQRQGVAYVVIGGLAVGLLAVLALVLTSNEISSKKQQSAELEKKTAAAQAEAGSLGPVADFLDIKNSREQSVRDLAGRRFDWERLTREVARVIPPGAYVSSLSASVDGQDSSSTTATSTSTAAAAAAAGTAGPKLSIAGCAIDQKQVATLLVRLKQLHFATDAALEESSRAGAASGTGVSSGPAGGGASGGVERPCTKYEFKASVSFDPASVAGADPTGAKRVPASLGGGK